MQIEIQQKPDKEFKEDRKIKSTQDIYNLEEIQAIKGAIQEHIIFIGLNNTNNKKLLFWIFCKNIEIHTK